MTTRRQFLQTSAATALGLAALPKLFADDKKADEFGGFTLGAQSYTFREFDLEPAIKRMKDLDLHYAELFQKHAPLCVQKRLVSPAGVSPAGVTIGSPVA